MGIVIKEKKSKGRLRKGFLAEAFELGPNGEMDHFQEEKSGECIRGKKMLVGTQRRDAAGPTCHKPPSDTWKEPQPQGNPTSLGNTAAPKGGSENDGSPWFSTRVAAPSGVTAGE